jgi:hypothetical protein|tara:strand:- start:613 stop:750 length:138 start_codon:yes stop_codon:yes gene_type:complete
MRKVFGISQNIKSTKKKTRQGQGRHTKFGTKSSKKYYKKRSVGQG